MCAPGMTFLPTLGFITPHHQLKQADCPHPSYLFEVALHGLVGQQEHRAHQVAHQDEVALGLQVERHDVVVVVALGAELLLLRPFIEPHLGGGGGGSAFLSAPGACTNLNPPFATPLTQVQCGCEMVCCGTWVSVCNYYTFMKDEN